MCRGYGEDRFGVMFVEAYGICQRMASCVASRGGAKEISDRSVWMVQGAARTDEVPDLLVLLDSLVKGLDVLGQCLEILGRLFQSSEVGRGGIGSGEGVQLDGGLNGSAPLVVVSDGRAELLPPKSVAWQLHFSRTFKICPMYRARHERMSVSKPPHPPVSPNLSRAIKTHLDALSRSGVTPSEGSPNRAGHFGYGEM